MSDASLLAKAGVQERIATPSSFVARIKPPNLAENGQETSLVAFRIASGNWTIQAKAVLRNRDPTRGTTARFLLKVVEKTTEVSDRANATVFESGYATVSLMLGVRTSTISEIELSILSEIPAVTLENVVLSAIRHGDLALIDK
jgi:hypothetical protein